jgi:signal transduction histidine kinase/DNA-binding LacI/PurR family transcriptional regulator/putative methionine-R-sulfoxide reductase with GAF domain
MSRARRKKPQKRLTIGYLTHWIGPSYRAMWPGIYDTACKHDVNLICFPAGQLRTPHQLRQSNVIFDLITAEKLDGLILRSEALAAHIPPKEFEALYKKYSPIPMVSIARALPGIPCLLLDNMQGMRSVITHLIETHGYRHIAFIRGPESHQEAEQRYHTYTQVLGEYDLPFDPNLVVAGDFTEHIGAEAARLLLDQRKLLPGKELEVIVAANDSMALGALGVLQARGIRVPDDVALVGFDDLDASKYTVPALTTVRNPFYKLGVEATEMLLAQIDGRDVPECTVLPLDLIVRQSCGCPLSDTIQTVTDPVIHYSPEKSDERAPLSTRRQSILSTLIQSIDIPANGEWAEQLLDAFIAQVEKEGVVFLATLEDTLRQAVTSNTNVFAWQDVLSLLRRHTLPYLDRNDASSAEAILDQARILVGDIARRQEGYRAVLAARRAQKLQRLDFALTTDFNLTELLDVATREIPKTGILNSYISLFENPQRPPDQSRLILALDGGKRVDLEPGGRLFPTCQLVPDGLLSPERRHCLVVEPLHFHDHELGFALFEAGPSQEEACDVLQSQIGGALQGVLLLKARAEAEAALEKAYAEVEMQVEEHTAELEQEIGERKQVEAERERLLKTLKRRSIHLQTATEVSRAASSILDVDELVQQAVDLVRERLGLYYVGLFLVDQTGERVPDSMDHTEPGQWAVLRSGTGEAGRQMVEHGHGVEIGGDSIVGQCIANKRACLLLNGSKSSGFGVDPLLPDARSELALPLISRSQATGAITIQSSEETAFSEEDVAVLQTMADQLANAIENARLYEQARRELAERKRVEKALKHRLEQLAALSQASQAVTASLEPDQVLAEIVSLANEVVDADYTGVVLVDETGQIGQSAENLPGVQALEYRIRSNGFTSWIVRLRRAVIVDEISADGAVYPSLGEGAPREANPLLVQANIKSLAGLPLMVKDRLLGVLYLHSLHTNTFGGQLFLLTAFANQVAIALENARLFQTEQQQTQRLALLVDVARIAATTFDADALLQAVADSIFRHYNHPRVGLFTLDDEDQKLILRGRSSETIALNELAVPGFYSLKIDQGIAGYVARTGNPHLAPDVSTDPYFVNPTKIPAQSALCVPILEGDTVVGTIILESERSAGFDQEDQSSLEAVASTVAIGLRNARLYNETQRRVQELTLLNSIAIRPGAMPDTDTSIKSALEGLHQLIKVDRIAFISIDPSAHTWKVTHEWLAPGVGSVIDLNGSFDITPPELVALLDNQPFAIADAANDPRLEATRELYHSLAAKSVLMMPVQSSGRFYGALGLGDCHENRTWQADESRLLEAVARQLALVLENTYLFEETQQRAEELAAALTQLEEMDQLKDAFIQNVSHELRSPLALIRGYAEMLDSGEIGEVPADQKKPVAIIARRARMLSDLVKDITLILEAEVSPPEAQPIPLDELTQNAVEDFQVEIDQAELTLEAEIEPGLPPVSGDPTYMRRVLDNLIGNAVKFTPAGGKITVSLRQDGGTVALAVSDTGVGIPVDKLTRIFDRFYQVDGSARRRHGGVGLGLALVKEIVEAYGGRVTVESELEKGSTFTAYIPIVDDTRDAAKGRAR